MRQTIRYRISMNGVRRLLCGLGVLVLLGGCGPMIESVRYISLDGYADARVTEQARLKPPKPNFFVGEVPTRYEIKRVGYTLVFEMSSNHFDPVMVLNVRPYPEYRIGFHDATARQPEPCVSWAWDKRKPGEWFFQNWCHKKDNDGDIDMHLRFTVFDQDGNVVAEEAIPYTVERNGFYGYYDSI